MLRDNPRTDLRRLIPAVMDLYLSGCLHLYDAEYVARLKPASQLSAARKCLKANFTMVTGHAPVRSVISHGHPGTRNAS